MYICIDCERLFDQFETVEEARPYGEGSAAEKWAVCPHCSSSNIEEAVKCENCGEYTVELTDGLCSYCYEDICGGEQHD